MVLSMALANFICAMFLFIRLKLFRQINFKLYDKELIKSMYKYSIPLVPNGISWWIINVSDRTIISLVLGASFNGIYAVSNKFPTIISSLTGVINLSWSESAAVNIKSKDRDSFFSDTINANIKIFMALGLMMISIIPFVFPMLINIKYSDAYNYIPILVLESLFNVVICLYRNYYRFNIIDFYRFLDFKIL